ncbi:vexin [Pyxicephalus adspersus]|uniref:vexin n=1 Tax=Pyxicephalus adspersus TaxID=30357 RepID=UPI003B5CFE02
MHHSTSLTMNHICSHREDTLQTLNSSFSAKAYVRPRRRAMGSQKITFTNVTASPGSANHWTQKYLPQQPDLLQVLYSKDEVWKLPPPQPCRPRRCNRQTGTENTKTPKFTTNHQNVQHQNKSLSSSPLTQSVNKQISCTLPAGDVTPATNGCNNHRLVHTEEDVCFENEANLLLTAVSTPKKSPSLLQKMGFKPRKTVEYISASNCAFEEE